MSKHEIEENCEVCQQEETKSPSLKISGTKILERVILPSNECWICDLKFEDSDSQVNHYTEHHECEICNRYYYALLEKRKHHCQICGKCFRYIFQKRDHIKEEHPNSDI